MSKSSARAEQAGRTSCLAGGGAAGARLRAIDWRATPLGPIDRWPASLRAGVGIVLAAPTPLCLLWGPQRILVYNDAFAASPLVSGLDALVRPGSQALAGFWNELAPLCDRVHTFGDVVEHVLARSTDGPVESIAVSLAPVEGSADETGGVLFAVLGNAGDAAGLEEREAALARREAALYRLANTIPALVAEVGPDLRFRFANQAYESWFRIPAADIVGRHVREVIGAEAFETIRAEIEAVLAGRPVAYERWLPYRTGRRFVHAALTPRVTAGRPDGFFVLVTDITGRREIEDALRASEERYRRMFESAEVSLWEEDFSPIAQDLRALHDRHETKLCEHLRARPEVVDGLLSRVRVLDVNETTLALFKASSKEQFVGTWQQVALPETRVTLAEELAALAEGRDRYAAETVMRNLQGDRLHVVLNVLVPVPGDLGRVLITIIDVTARRQAEEQNQLLAGVSAALAGSLDYVESLVRIARATVPRMGDWCAVDVLDEGRSRRLARVRAAGTARARAQVERYPVGAGPDHAIDRVARQALDTGRPALADDVGEDLLAAIAWDEEELSHLRVLGVHSYLCVPLAARGRALGVLRFAAAGTGRRFTDADLALAEEIARRAGTAIDNARLYREAQQELKRRRATEQALRENRERLRLALAAGRMGTWSYELVPAPRIVWSRELQTVMGLTPGEFRGTIDAFLDVVEPADRERVAAALERAHRGPEEIEIEYRIRRPDGVGLWMVARGRAHFDSAGQPLRIAGIAVDITEQKRAEELLELRVREQQAVASLGRMALETEDLQAVFDMTVALLAQTLDAEYAKVLELLPDGRALVLRAGVGWHEGLVGRATVGAGVDTQAGYTLAAETAVVVDDYTTEARFPKSTLLHDHGVVSGMSATIRDSRERPFGVLGVYTRVPRRFSPEDVSFLEAVSHVLSAAIQRHRSLRELQHARADLERRVEERTTELARLNQSLRDEIVERMGVEAALRDSEAQYRLLFERNPLPAWVFDLDTHEILAANETAVWKYGYTREDLLRMRIDELHPPEDLERTLDYTERFPPETAYVGAWRHRKHDETVVDVELFAYEVLFRGRWARLVLANDITERKRAEQEARVLESIARAISEAVDVDEALHAVLYHVCQTTGWLLGEAWVPAADGVRLIKSPAWYGATDEFAAFVAASEGAALRPAESMIGRAWSTRQPVWVPDVTLDGDVVRVGAARAAGLRSGIAFPVIAGAEVVAVLAFFLKEERREDEQLIKLVTTVAAHVGLAIQRKRAEERLRESEERFRWLVEGAQDYALYMLDPEGRVASWNRGVQRLKGYDEAEVLGRHFSMFYTEDDVRCGLPQQALERAARDGVYESEGWRVRKDRSRFWANATVTALRDAGGALRGFVKVTRDISERREAEERLRESEARLARAQEFSLLMVAHTALDGRWLKVPPMLCALLGYTEEELLAGRFRDVSHPDDFEAEWTLCERLIRGEAKSFDLEKRFLRRDGKVVWVYQNTSVVLDAEDRPLHFLTFVRDITERREAEEQLRKSELQLSEAQRLAHLGSWEWNIGDGHVEWSDELYRIYGIEPGTSISFETYLERVHAEDRARVKDVVAEAIRQREPFTMEERIVRADGEVRHLLSQAALIVDGKGEATRMVGVCLDITERKRAEERVREYASRLQGLSLRLLEAQETERRRIARELHDQIGQDLSVIKINLQTLKRLPGGGVLGGYIDETIRVVEGVLATARNLSLELRPSMLDDLGLAAALRWYLDRQAQRSGFALHFEARTGERRVPPAIETACFRLAQEAVTNIMRHAGASRVSVTLALDAQALRLRIADDGQGFDVEAARARASRGESFGLLGMEERALLAGGRLEIISAPSQGAEVHVHFPLGGDNQ